MLKYYPHECDVYIRECAREDVWEIDTVEELRALEERVKGSKKANGIEGE